MANIVPEIVTYTSEYQPWFEKFNRDWIEKYFWMETIDFDVLKNPEKHIIEKGGTILMALYDKEIAGTVALKFVKPGIYEFTKMAVDEKFRGKKVGKALAEAAIEKAKLLAADKIILYSNTILEPAIALYKKLGFIEVPVDGPYARSNIKMELKLATNSLTHIKIREATLQDADKLRALGIKTFSETFAPHNTEQDMELYLERSFAAGEVEKEIQEPQTTFLLAYDIDQLIGYAKIRASGIPDGLIGFVNPIEIERIYVAKEHLGKKIGKILMEVCLTLAKQRGHDCIWLGVWEHNVRAISFYEKWGFEKFGSHPFLLGTDLQTDLLMNKKLQ